MLPKMKVLILGADGYLGWPTAMDFAERGHDVLAVDNYFRRTLMEECASLPLISAPNLAERAKLFFEVTGKEIKTQVADLRISDRMNDLVREFKPDVIVHYAEQPSAPYSMMNFDSAKLTLDNNIGVTFNLIWAVKEYAADCHIIKLGTMGEYGTPNIDIEEGWIDIEHKGRVHKALYPRAAGSLYHTTKVLDTDLLWFYVRMHGLKVTDLMQGPVYGFTTPQTELHPDLGTCFSYDDIFGTVVNRFLVLAVAQLPLTVYGGGGQTRGYLNLIDTLQCIQLASESPVEAGELRIMNQFTETFSVLDIAEKIKLAAKQHSIDVTVKSIPNPRIESEDHYYNPVHSSFSKLGIQPTLMTSTILGNMIEKLIQSKDRIDVKLVQPRVSWK